jgi:hypothetical protein
VLSWAYISFNLNNIMFIPFTKFFDKLEDKVRFKLSHYPITFAFIGGFAIVEFWRGVWHLTDLISEKLNYDPYGLESSLFSIILASIILLMTGLYVSLFLTNDNIIVSGKKGESKKLFEKTEEEIRTEKMIMREELREELKIANLEQKVDSLVKEIKELKDVLANK